jgi:ABC-type bacteriocin/lantibiotic exporter with double-glycine peptidase domain
LLQLIAGVVRPDSGAVDVRGAGTDPVPVAELDPGWWRGQLGWAAQGGALQAGTIRQNLSLGHPGLDEAALRAALVAVDAADFVDALPGGLEHRLGDGGAGLSQGQRQRLTLARDGDTEQRVLAGIRRYLAGRTVVLVTHRPGPLALADHVVRLETAAIEQTDPADGEAGTALATTGVNPW